jgi:hypothetical protein
MSGHTYFIMECYGPDDEERASLGAVPLFEGINWYLGRRFDKAPPTPIQVGLHPDSPDLLMPMFDRSILLFTDELISALAEAGVDNLDCYDAVIVHPKNGKRFTNYKAVNIIGLVVAADLPASTYKAHSGSTLVDVDFDSLSIDESKTRGLLMFRLAECVTAIVVHEKVKKHVEARGIRYLDWVPPQDWVG